MTIFAIRVRAFGSPRENGKRLMRIPTHGLGNERTMGGKEAIFVASASQTNMLLLAVDCLSTSDVPANQDQLANPFGVRLADYAKLLRHV